MKKAKRNDHRSKELTNVKSIPLPAPGLRTCCSGYIMEQQYNEQWQKDRMQRLKDGTNYSQSPLNPIYIPVNKNVLDLRMIRNNNLQQTLMDMQSLTKYVNMHTHYDPVLQGPPTRRNLYSGNNFYVNLM